MIRWILFASLCWPLTAHLEVYKWVDADGNVHFTDKKPDAEIDAETVDTSATELSESRLQAAQRRDELFRQSASKTREARSETEKQRSEQRAQSGKEQERRTANCATARQNLANSRPFNRIYTIDEQGNRTYLNDDEQLAKAEASRKAIAEYCN